MPQDKTETFPRTVLVTGASTGIGAATATHLSQLGWRVFASVRKQADGDALKAGSTGDLRPILLDVTQPDSLEAAVKTVAKALGRQRLAGLVNNAGIARMGPLAIQPLADFEAHFAVNVFGLLRATQAFVPLLGSDPARTGPPGRIVNITSVGGRISAPFLGAYTATKHAVEAMTDTLRRELVIYGIDAIAVGPGAVRTPIWDKAEADNVDQPYAASDWAAPLKQFEKVMLNGGHTGLPASDVAKVIQTALEDPSPRARYAPVPNKLTNWSIPSRLPKRTLDGIFRKRFGMRKPD
ncbi:SDR family oxidoreductase [Hyphomonas johnsonii]|uniref:Short chain dehydrogenase/reductase family oxidoreductase n=1 Tax=Hyphomonas johnsonii MHS-2 TaxID=1280950 RepID=A0A059FM45_9PROT|nr:SDR family oxidoreductase [Hyphomonas johnsonii]KCZ91682.1 short chain dehydrogenase/reductase family oxidoreductase [Hyphomonas johnsonii MHS-2]